MIETNKYQLQLTEELIKKLPKDVYSNLINIIDTIPFIKWLIQPEKERGFIKDRPLGKDGRRIIDITKPHILENIDFFRERAIFYESNGKYTNIPPNGNPKSEYAQFWREELHKWRYGVTRPDGEWIPGLLYFYWNYSPIWLVETEGEGFTFEQWFEKIINPNGKKSKKKKLKGNRVRKFPKPWLGDYLYYHYLQQCLDEGQHAKLLKTRGIGFSFKSGAISPCFMYTYPGTGNGNFHLASEKTFLDGDKGVFGKVLNSLDWIAENTPLPKLRLIDSKQKMNIKLGYYDEYGIAKGNLSYVTAISLKDNPDKARGIRGKLIHYEEDGLFPNLEKAWGVNRKAMEDGDTTFGLMLAGGTGGVEGKSFEGSEKLFYYPSAYNIKSIPNVYDKNTNGKTQCGFFWGAYLNRNNCYESKNGEPDVVKALIEILANRKHIRENSSDPSAITQAMAEECITPQEAIMRTEGTIFPVADLKDYLSDILPNLQSFVSQHYTGRLKVNAEGNIELDPSIESTPIREYPIQNNKNKEGCIEIFQKPITNSNGKIPYGRYISGLDPYDDDESTTNSLGSLFIMDTITEQIVAEYTGRPRTAVEFYENCYRLLKYYNAICNYENDKKGFFSYLDRKNALYLLCDNPKILKDMDMMRAGYGNKSKGTNSGKNINRWGRRLQADWLVQQAYSVDEDTPDRLNTHTVRSIGYLKELIAWNPNLNADRVSAMGMLMILKEDRAKIQIDINKKTKEKFMANNFWNKHFKNGRKLRY